MKTLKDVAIGRSAHVVKVHGEGPIKRRLMDMGLTRGIEVKVRKVAPLGDPIEIEIRGFNLAIRRSLASKIKIDKVGE